MFISLVIKLIRSLIASFRSSRFDVFVVPTLNVIVNGFGSVKLHMSPNTGQTVVLLLLNKGSPSMLRDKIYALFTASISV